MKVAYFFDHFPVALQTFMRRELAGVITAGIKPLIIAKDGEPFEDDDPDMRLIAPHLRAFFPLLPDNLTRYRRRFSRRWLRYVQVWFLIFVTHYSRLKSRLEDRRLFERVIYLAGMVEDESITHLHAPWANSTAFEVMLAARLSGITYSVQARATQDLFRKSTRLALREKLERAAFIIASSEYNRAFLTHLLGDRLPTIHVIYDALDLSQFVPREKELSPVITLLCVARLIETKGLTYLLQACHALKARGHTFRCDIIGGKDERRNKRYYDTLMAMHRGLGLEDVVTFRGYQRARAVIDAVRAADIFVLPCVITKDESRDGIPNSIVEAMALEVPVVSTTVGGIPEAIEHGREGLLVSPGNVEELVAALESLMNKPERRRALGRAAREKVARRFNIETIRERYRKLFESV